MDTITLTLHKKWFDLILSDEKTEEYREIKPYWVRRLIGNYQQYNDGSVFYRGDYMMPFGVSRIRFRNGYAKDAREMIVEWLGISVGAPNPNWCDHADIGRILFCLKLGRIISTN
jgi:hypothetical protein